MPIPDGMYPAVTLTQEGNNNGQQTRSAFYLGFDALGTAAPRHYAGYVPYLWVNANALASIDQLPEGATEYPEDSDILLVYHFFGFGVEIEPRGMTGTRDEKLSFAADIFRTIHVYPGAAADPSVWGDPTAS